jgi:hypothetical protein
MDRRHAVGDRVFEGQEFRAMQRFFRLFLADSPKMCILPFGGQDADLTAASEAGMIDERVPGTKRRLDGRRWTLRGTGAPAKAAMDAAFAGIGTKQAGMEEKNKKTRGGSAQVLEKARFGQGDHS